MQQQEKEESLTQKKKKKKGKIRYSPWRQELHRTLEKRELYSSPPREKGPHCSLHRKGKGARGIA